MLKVLGELMIALFVVGYAAPRFPDPPWDAARTHGAADGCRRGLIGGWARRTSALAPTAASVM